MVFFLLLDRQTEQLRYFFLNVDDQFGFFQAFSQARVLALQACNLCRLWILFRAALFGCQPIQFPTLALPAPGGDVRGIQPFPPQQGALLSRLPTGFILLQNAVLVLCGESSALSLWNDFWIGRSFSSALFP